MKYWLRGPWFNGKARKMHTYRRVQHFAVGSVSLISIVLQLKLTSTVILKELYSIEKCAICLETFLKF